jgi:hypothetical protein
VYRTRPWTVVLLLTVTGLAVGFARLDAVRQAAPPEPAPVAAPEPDRADEAARQVRRYFEDLAQYLRETEAIAVPHVALPPLHQLPPLPSEFLPEQAVADLPTDSGAAEDASS